jgi:8-amino-7-oxononanoate synthase
MIAVESVYSMDGDICPLQELIDAVKEIMPVGNTQFFVDETHTTGVIGPRGGGLVCELGVEKEVTIRLHTFGKALASTGGTLASFVSVQGPETDETSAVILGTNNIKSALINFARGIIFTTAPGFPAAAAVRSAYTLMATGQTMQVSFLVQASITSLLDL